MTESEVLVTEIPSSLKQLARIVVRAFYAIEDSLIIDMLVRYPCLREDDICELLKFDRKMLRARISSLKHDKFLMVKTKMETGDDGKVVKMNCYFINYKTFVNIVKYKLDHMHKKMETSERDATSRSSFKCRDCGKNFTDLEANELFDPQINEFRCTFCGGQVDEDASAGPQQDSRLLLARFNTQMEKLDELLKAVEDIKLAPIVLEPEPAELANGRVHRAENNVSGSRGESGGGHWTGESSRGTGGFRVDSQALNITFGEKESSDSSMRKEVPVWISESTVGNTNLENKDDLSNFPSHAPPLQPPPPPSASFVSDEPFETNDEIANLLLRHEKRQTADTKSSKPIIPGAESDSSDESDFEEPVKKTNMDFEVMSEDEENEDGDIPSVTVGAEEILVTNITEDVVSKMTPNEKEKYMQVFQDYYAHMYE